MGRGTRRGVPPVARFRKWTGWTGWEAEVRSQKSEVRGQREKPLKRLGLCSGGRCTSMNGGVNGRGNATRRAALDRFRKWTGWREWTGWEAEVRGQKAKVRGQRSEGRGQRSEVRGQRSEVRGQRSEIRGQRSELRGQRAEVRAQRAEVRRQRRRGIWGQGRRAVRVDHSRRIFSQRARRCWARSRAFLRLRPLANPQREVAPGISKPGKSALSTAVWSARANSCS
jgi:hypothetical protein